jgi:hypothetical protein
LKQKAFVDQTIKTLNPSEAARIVYGNENDSVNRSIAAQNMAKPEIMREIEHAMEKVGLNSRFAAKRLKQIIKSPEKLDGISVAALNTAGRWRGWDAPESQFELPDIPRSAQEIDILLIKMRKNVTK